MKEIKLLSLSMRNFKGIKDRLMEFDGNSANIYGDNEAGKTTLFDAYTFVLFGKDSQGNANFAWKPLDKDNNEIHHLESEVIAKFLIDGEPLELCRTNSENWKKKNGTAEKEFSGHGTTFRINGIKANKTNYTKKIEEIIDEETFKQATDIYYLERMKPKDRRTLLFQLFGDMTDQEVIDSDPELTKLNDVLDGRSVDDKRELIREERKNINDDITSLPSRIDEVDRSIAELGLDQLDKDVIETSIANLDNEISKNEVTISSIKNGDQVTKLNAELGEKQLELNTARSNHKMKQNDAVEGLQNKKHTLRDEAIEANGLVETEEATKEQAAAEIEVNKKEIVKKTALQDEIREQFIKKSEEEYPEFDEHKKTCSLCGQEYPEDQKEVIMAKYEEEKAAFNIEKSECLEYIRKEGISLGEEIDGLKAKNEVSMKVIEDNKLLEQLIADRDAKKKEFEDIKKEIENINETFERFEETKEYDKLVAEVDKINAAIMRSKESVDKQKEPYELKLIELKQQRDELKEQLDGFRAAAKAEVRKQELIDKEKTLNSRLGLLEDQLFLLDQFVRTKVELVTDRINKNFKMVEFKLFENQINGGLKEICEPIVNGVPFSSGLNNAARVNAGIDIVTTIQRVKSIKSPVFVDNAESVTKIIEEDAQIIALYVTEGQKELKLTQLKGDK